MPEPSPVLVFVNDDRDTVDTGDAWIDLSTSDAREVARTLHEHLYTIETG